MKKKQNLSSKMNMKYLRKLDGIGKYTFHPHNQTTLWSSHTEQDKTWFPQHTEDDCPKTRFTCNLLALKSYPDEVEKASIAKYIINVYVT